MNKYTYRCTVYGEEKKVDIEASDSETAYNTFVAWVNEKFGNPDNEDVEFIDCEIVEGDDNDSQTIS